MGNIEKYYDNTESEKPRKNVQYFIEKVKCNPGKAIELGCGAGNDTVYLIKMAGMYLQLIEKVLKKEFLKD